MRYGIISDIHGNLEALEAVLSECRNLEVGALLCAGDVVGYGANPKECLDKIRSMKAVIVAGNHDWAVSGKLDFSHFTPDGQAAVMWTRPRLSFEDLDFLSNLPLTLENKDCILVHSALANPSEFTYLTNLAYAGETFALMNVPLCFVGHTHVPKIYIETNGKKYEHQALFVQVVAGCKYIINVGSVGQPRDGSPMASFCVYDTATQIIEIHRVLYNVKKAQQKIIEAGLPEFLSMRLARGQ
jgi:diadenosine tetraphosphatase ApaH/serine/threonine PP2A family protein phosphatase